MSNKYMKEALIEAYKAFNEDEVPIGAVIVQKGKIIARAHNAKEKNNNPLCHAEIIAINNACKFTGDWRLNDCELYVTIEPCLMCCGAIIQSRIKKVVYGAPNTKFGYVESLDSVLNNPSNNHKVEIERGICINECQNLMSAFFESKRK